MNRWRVGPALVAKWPAVVVDLEQLAGQDGAVAGRTQRRLVGSPDGATWHDDCAEDAGAYKSP